MGHVPCSCLCVFSSRSGYALFLAETGGKLIGYDVNISLFEHFGQFGAVCGKFNTYTNSQGVSKIFGQCILQPHAAALVVEVCVGAADGANDEFAGL